MAHQNLSEKVNAVIDVFDLSIFGVHVRIRFSVDVFAKRVETV